MVISFPILVSETVDKDILPYLLKAIERKFALDYLPILEQMVRTELDKSESRVECVEGIIIEGEHKNISKQLILESDFGIQVKPAESNKINSDQPYFVTVTVTTASRVTQEYVFGFKAISLITAEALDVFRDELYESNYYLHRLVRKMFGAKFIWQMYKWYQKIFNNDYTKSEEYETKKVLFSEEKERLCVLSVNDLTRESFERNDPNEDPLSSKLLSKARWSGLYLDDSINKRIYFWDEKTPKFSAIIPYDMLYKAALGVLPEQIEKAKQKDKFLFSRTMPADSIFNKVLKK